MRGYDELYFEAIYKLKKVQRELEATKQELELYKNAEGKDLKKFIIDEVMKYINKNKQKDLVEKE